MILPPVVPPIPPPVDLLPLPDLEPIIPLTMAALPPQTVTVLPLEEPAVLSIEPVYHAPEHVTQSSIALESSLL